MKLQKVKTIKNYFLKNSVGITCKDKSKFLVYRSLVLIMSANVAKTSTALTKNSVIEGFKVSNHAWRKSGLGRGATEELISHVITGGKKSQYCNH